MSMTAIDFENAKTRIQKADPSCCLTSADGSSTLHFAQALRNQFGDQALREVFTLLEQRRACAPSTPAGGMILPPAPMNDLKGGT